MAKVEKRDLLKELYEKKITEKEALEFWHNVEGFDAYAQIGITSFKECLAVDIIPFKLLAKWRYEGWPLCAVCGKFCDMDNREGFPTGKRSINKKMRRNIILHNDCEPLPYADFRDLAIWPILERSIEDLQNSLEIRTTTLQDYVVGYMALTLMKNKKTKGLV